jgi:hypothetical protein
MGVKDSSSRLGSEESEEEEVEEESSSRSRKASMSPRE